MPPVKLSSVNATLLPPTLIDAIFTQTVEQSAIQQLARRVPLSVSAATAIPIPMDVPEADWVVEGGSKPVGGSSVGIKTMTGKKVAVMIPVSEELVMTDAGQLWTQLQNDLPTAIGRAFDFAAVHGKTIKGSGGPFADYLASTTNQVVLGTATAADGGLYDDLVSGEELITNNNYDFRGFAADPRLIPLLKRSYDSQGHPIFVNDVVTGGGAGGAGTGVIDGFPASYNRGISGAIRRQSNQGVRTFTDAALTSASAVLTSVTGSFSQADKGAHITGTGIPGGTTVLSVQSATSLTMSANASATEANDSVTITQTADTGLRAIGGDWSQCAYGVGREITIKLSTQASYVDTDGTTHSAFQENLVLILAEAYYGWVVGDINAFVAYT